LFLEQNNINLKFKSLIAGFCKRMSRKNSEVLSIYFTLALGTVLAVSEKLRANCEMEAVDGKIGKKNVI